MTERIISIVDGETRVDRLLRGSIVISMIMLGWHVVINLNHG